MARASNYCDTYWSRGEDPNYHALVEKYVSGELRLPTDPRRLSLYDFASSYSPRWEYTGRLVVVVPTPQYKKIPHQFIGKDKEVNQHHLEYCRTQLLLYKPGCSPANVLERSDGGNFDDAHVAFKHFVDNDVNCPPEVRRSFLDFLKAEEEAELAAAEAAAEAAANGGVAHEEAQPPNEMDFDPLVRSQPDNENEFQMLDVDRALAEIGVENLDNVDDDDEIVMNHADGLDLPLAESNDTDRLMLLAADEDPRELVNSFEHIKNANSSSVQQVSDRIDLATLNEDQTLLLNTIMTKLKAGEQILVDLTGGAGVGKSYGIKSIYQEATDIFGPGSVRIAAPTGCAAIQFVNGSTLHSLLKLPVKKKNKKAELEELDGAALKEIQERLGHMILLVIDEKVSTYWLLYIFTLYYHDD